MTPEVRQAWLNAGDWVVANWPNVAVAAALGIFAAWSIGRALRGANETVATILADLDHSTDTREEKP